jgi:hypothetical protein
MLSNETWMSAREIELGFLQDDTEESVTAATSHLSNMHDDQQHVGI